MSTQAVTPKFRPSWPVVFTPKRNDLNGKDEYSVVALFPKGTDLTVLKNAATAACKKKWGEDPAKWPPNLRSPFRDQGERAKVDPQTGKTILPAGHEAGAIFISLRSTQKPGVVNQQVQPILDQSEFYGGCWAIAQVNAFAYDNKGNRGVSFGLNHIQKVAEGEHFGARGKAEDAFVPVATEDTPAAATGSAATGAKPANTASLW